MGKNLYQRGLSLLLVAGVLLSCAACGAKTATTMHLRKTEGAVDVTAGEQTATVTAGEVAKISSDGVLTVEEFSGGEEIPAPFLGGGFDGTDEKYEEWARQKELEQQEYEAELERRFETLVELNLNGYESTEDYTYTLAEVRQQLTDE